VVALGAAAGCSQPDPSTGFDIQPPMPTPPAVTPSPLAAAISTDPARRGADETPPAPAATGTLAAAATPAGPDTPNWPFTAAGGHSGVDDLSDGDDAGMGDAPRCSAADLTVRLGNPVQVSALTPELTQFGLIITFVNGTTRTCGMYGFPGATLVTDAGDTFDLARRTTVMPASLRVPPGGGAAAVLTYLAATPAVGSPQATPPQTTPPPTAQPPAAQPAATPPVASPPAADAVPVTDMPAFDARYLLVTPPDERDSVRLAWAGGPVVDQRRDAYPASYVSPVTR